MRVPVTDYLVVQASNGLVGWGVLSVAAKYHRFQNWNFTTVPFTLSTKYDKNDESQINCRYNGTVFFYEKLMLWVVFEDRKKSVKTCVDLPCIQPRHKNCNNAGSVVKSTSFKRVLLI